MTRTICPLTYLEAFLKSKGNASRVYPGSFLIEKLESLIYVDDVTSAMVAASTAPNIDGMVINVGSGVETSVRDLINRVATRVVYVEPYPKSRARHVGTRAGLRRWHDGRGCDDSDGDGGGETECVELYREGH